jgi:hypothetical protein
MKKILTVLFLASGIILFSGCSFQKQKTISNSPSSSGMTESEAISTIKNNYSEFKEYPDNNLPPKSIKTEKGPDGWYVAFIQEGSGRPIIDVSCFLVKNDNGVMQRKYIAQDDAFVGEFSAKECRVIESIVGGDEDEHGCKGSAGYSWCQEKQKCLRSWEEPCEGNSGSLSCSLETCHGLDIKCGSNPPDVCTEMYGLGDKCLKYAKCGIKNNKCQPIENLEFTQCKICVENCIDENKNNDEKVFECENECK